ncbi:hypothetical protein GHNINEIG_02044 [Hydrogenovibrio crunogenus]|uniref:Uncharacterized protein n=1 Tax=Hydrogenovibrio crunogenus TaxID=39765 RepID=A0A4P7P289_9GAMM|nr:hypothetical protein [Hydrogenovibrio crunogenus]QBZ83975.1 hypothetical protein GHNINEIG_02044 [Hydrogenovibrio crunogenus]
MKWNKSTLAASILVTLITMINMPLATAANDDASFDAVKKESKELMQSLKSYSAKQKDEAIQATQKALNKIDARIDRLEEDVRKNWNEMDAATQKQTEESLKALRQQRNKVSEWYGSLKNSSAESWDQMKKGFSEAYQAVNQAWKKSVEAFQSED